MAIYYTTHEGGVIKLLPVKCQHSKIVKQLYKHRVGTIKSYHKIDKFHSHVKVTGVVLPFRVHSVFFTSNKRVTKIWDSNLNGYRLISQKIIIPENI
jgi:hypothetical protein